MKKIHLLFLIFLITGCYNYRELNDLAIVKGASVDIIDNQYTVSYIIAKSKENEITLLEGRGKNISDAISDMNLKTPKELYIDHMSIYVISEDVAKSGINKVLDYFFRNARHKKTFQLVIAKNNKAKDILKTMSTLNNFPADTIAKNLTSEISLSEFVFNTTMISFLKKVKDPGIEPIINGIKIDDNLLKLEPLAIFKDDKLIKWENTNISETISILINQSSSFKFEVPCDKNKIVFQINDLNVKKTFKISNNINFKIFIDGNTKINEMSCNYDLNNQNDLEKIEEILIKNLKNQLDKTIEELKIMNIDFLGLGYFIYQNDYYNYLNFKDNYIDKLSVEFKIQPNILMNENANEGTYLNE